MESLLKNIRPGPGKVVGAAALVNLIRGSSLADPFHNITDPYLNPNPTRKAVFLLSVQKYITQNYNFVLPILNVYQKKIISPINIICLLYFCEFTTSFCYYDPFQKADPDSPK